MAPPKGQPDPASATARELAARLAEAAREGCRKLRQERDVTMADEVSGADAELDLECPQCGSVLFEPTTLEDGVTVCGPCVGKRREGRKPEALPPWAPRLEDVGFGGSTSVVLTELTRRFCPEAQTTAASRQRANGLFREGKFREAEEAYSSALASAPSADAVLHCNRSAARLKLGDSAGAAADSLAALKLCARRTAVCGGPASPGGAIWAKAWFRLGQALLPAGDRRSEAAFALAMASSVAPPEEPLDARLVEAGAQLLTASEAEGSQSSQEALTRWLRQGACPSLSPELSADADADSSPGSSLQLVLESSEENALDQDAWVREQLECALCVGLLFEPATSPCGHTFCRPCLARLLDHAFDTSPTCPMCRRDFSSYLGWLNARATAAGGAFGSHGGAQIAVNSKLERILSRHFGTETAERRRQSASEEAAADHNGEDPVIPIFICSLAIPGAACPLHIFEPRYRLMMRRCIESGQRQFGMCLTPEAEYGTMLRILKFDQLPDGRSAIQTVGTRRFRVLEWGQKDGYATGRVQWVEDESCEPLVGDDGLAYPTGASPQAAQLRSAVGSLMQKLPARQRAAVLQQIGEVPSADGEDGPHCPALVFWCIALSVFSPKRSYELLFGDAFRRSPAQRLQAVLDDFRERLPFCFSDVEPDVEGARGQEAHGSEQENDGPEGAEDDTSDEACD